MPCKKKLKIAQLFPLFFLKFTHIVVAFKRKNRQQ